ncbi:MAG: class I SAM-dependent methyltransferase [Promethearchaeota archaeon]
MNSSNFNLIAKDYHLKRKKPWRPLEFFIDYLKKKGYSFKGTILDLGCANGRNFEIISTPPNKLIGIDISHELLMIAKDNLRNEELFSLNKSKFYQIILADIRYLPIRQDSIDCVFTVATLHHIKKKFQRKLTITQIRNILKNKGQLVLTVWRKWQRRFRNYFFLEWLKRNFSINYRKQQKAIGLEEFGDKLVTWTLSKERDVLYRFYHFFSKKELKKLLKDFNILEFKLTGGPTDKDNFFVFGRKS